VILVVDYGMGNLGSILNMFRRLGVPVRTSMYASDVASADRLVLPGVGAFDAAVTRLRELDLIPALNTAAIERRIPTLGVCLGMQLLTGSSEEGVLPGLGWLRARTVRFQLEPTTGLKIPHMGWNQVTPTLPDRLTDTFGADLRFYFAHSFHLACDDPRDVLATTTHGYEFPSVVERGNIRGAQFHPEKSHRYGLRFLQAFAAWEP
jgi:glutamine amidotransferase